MTPRDRAAPSAEHRVVLLAARAAGDPRARGRLEEVAAEVVDWPRVFGLASRTKVLPLVHRGLAVLPAHLVPERAREDLGARMHAVARANQRKVGELVRLMALLDSEGIRVLPLKGPLLAETLYGDVARRQFADLDLHVPPGEFPSAVKLILAEGYRPIHPDRVLPPDRIRAVQRHFDVANFSFTHPDRGIQLELHWRLVERSTRSEDLLGELATVELWGRRIPVFRPGALIRYLSLHGAKDMWRRLLWVSDVAAFLERFPDLDWGRVWHDATREGGAARLALGLHLARRHFGGEIPREIRSGFARHRRVVERAADRSPVFSATRSSDTSLFAYGRYQVGVRERWRDRIHFLLVYLLLPKHSSFGEVDVPAALYPFLTVLRPVRFLLRRVTRR